MSAKTETCCMCGKIGLSTVEGDGGSECEVDGGKWVCGWECWDSYVDDETASNRKAKDETR